MTRAEQIQQANPMKLSDSEQREWDQGETIYDYRGHYSEGFEDGAEWADAHPAWHDYRIDRKFPEEVILYTLMGTFSAKYDAHLNMFSSGGEWIDESTIIAWMKIPEPPKFD